MLRTSQPHEQVSLKNKSKGWKLFLNKRFLPIVILSILSLEIVSPSGADPAENAPHFSLSHVLFSEAEAAESPYTTKKETYIL